MVKAAKHTSAEDDNGADKRDDNDEEDGETNQDRMSENNRLESTYDCIKGYVTQLPLLGFNSARYDPNVAKRLIACHLKNFVKRVIRMPASPQKFLDSLTCLIFGVEKTRGYATADAQNILQWFEESHYHRGSVCPSSTGMARRRRYKVSSSGIPTWTFNPS